MGWFKFTGVGARPFLVGVVVLFMWGFPGHGNAQADASAQARSGKPTAENGHGGMPNVSGLRCAPRLLAVTPGGARAMTVRVDTAPKADLTVNLAVSNPLVASVPAAITIPAGQTSAPVTVTGGAGGSAFITARTEAEQAACSVYVADRLSDPVVRFPTASVRVTIGSPHERPEPPKLAPPVRVMILPVPFAVTRPVKVELRAPSAPE